ncbi:hypothetical protein HG717_01285 [Rhodococcus erythropolis]|uniref:hypothetical protein n=1 Tax=Rhodococcus TaxID=1827 RepID=UPI001AE4CBA6|nr:MULTISPECIES: hypothetical protein [Rhodococcus]MBP2520949.1 hypothetical protein [Rhodococcus sp. PvP104]MBY6382545.1 hypothetical protein [Rhodococcus erythropolis]
MTNYDSEFDALLGRGRVYDSAEQLRATPAGTPIADAEGGHWIRGYNDPAEPRWRHQAAPQLIWIGIGGGHDRRQSAEIPLPAAHAATDDFWPTTLLEGPLTPVSIGSIPGGHVGPIPGSIGSIPGGCVGGNPGLSVRAAVENGISANGEVTADANLLKDLGN